MGAGNVKLTYARWHRLPDLPFRVLAYMALVSMDGDEAPAYWGGWESLALAAGRIVPDRSDDPDVKKTRRAALKAVNAAVKVLLERGAIRVTASAAPGRNTTYALNFAYQTVHADREPSTGIDEPNGSRLPDPTVHAQPAQRFTVTRPTVHGEREPEEYEEEVRTQPKTENTDLDLNVTGPRESNAAEDPIFSSEFSERHLRLVVDEKPAPRTRPVVGRPRWSTRGTDVVAEAMARRAARVAAHQQNAGEAS